MAKGYQPTGPNDSDGLVDENAITTSSAESLANARANAGIGVDGDAALSGAEAEQGGAGGSAKADSTQDRAGSANTGAAPAQVAGTGDPDANKSALQKESEEASRSTRGTTKK